MFSTNTKSRFVSVVLDSVLVSLVVPETTHEVSLALQGFETETRELLGGTEDNIASSTRS